MSQGHCQDAVSSSQIYLLSVLASFSGRVSPTAANLATSSSSSTLAHRTTEETVALSQWYQQIPRLMLTGLDKSRPPRTKHSISKCSGLGRMPSPTPSLRPGAGVNPPKPEESEESVFTMTSQGLLPKEGRRGIRLALKLVSTVLGNTWGLREGNSMSRVMW